MFKLKGQFSLLLACPFLSFKSVIPDIFSLHICVLSSSFFLFVPFLFLFLKLLVYADSDPYAVAGVCNDHGKTYALYAITVHRRNANSEEMWKTYRRYSDFHDFHMRITEQVTHLMKTFTGALLCSLVIDDCMISL